MNRIAVAKKLIMLAKELSAANKPYVGIRGGKYEVFYAGETPTEESHGHKYNAVIGPFRTKAGAQCMADYGGHGNPHLQTVNDAEKMAERLKNK